MTTAAKSSDWKWALSTGLGAAIFIGGIIWAAHSEISKLDDRIAAVDKHISRVEMAVRIVGARQAGDTKTLIDEALTIAKKDSAAGRVENAKIILTIANGLLAEQAATRVEAPSKFFDDALVNLAVIRRTPQLAESARAGTMTLAEYKSAISVVPPNFANVKIGHMQRMGQFLYLKDSVIGPHTIVFTGRGSGDTFEIDNLIAENVVFRDLTIVYRGGPLQLRDVRFVNCRFEVPRVPAGDQVLEAIVKQPANVQIG